jgi:hypothetical protein
MVYKKYLTLFLFFTSSFFGCQNTGDENIMDDDAIDNSTLITLKTKTINITQIIEGVSQERSVIIQTPVNVDTSKDYPVVLAFH